MSAPQTVSPEKTIFDVAHDVWQARIYMLGFAVVMLVCAFIFISLSQKFYVAEMIVAPASPMGRGMQNTAHIGEGSIQVQSENLQSTAGFLRFEHIYNGVSVAAILLQDKKIIEVLGLDKGDWDASTFSEYLKKRVKLEPVNGTVLRRISYLHPDKKFASYMIYRIHWVSDRMIRKTILLQANERMVYLNKSLSVTTNTGHRANLTALLMEQERLKMLVALDQPYAATIIEKPFTYSRIRYPDPYVVYPIFLLVGLFLGFIAYGLRHHNA